MTTGGDRIDWSRDPEECLIQVLGYAEEFDSVSAWNNGHPRSYLKAVNTWDSDGVSLKDRVAEALEWGDDYLPQVTF